MDARCVCGLGGGCRGGGGLQGELLTALVKVGDLGVGACCPRCVLWGTLLCSVQSCVRSLITNTPPPTHTHQVYKSPALLQELTRPGLDDAPGDGGKRKAA